MIRSRAAAGGAVLAGLGAGLCCMGPIVAGVFGAGAAGLASAAEPARPYLLWLMAAALALAAYRYVRPRVGAGAITESGGSCADGVACATPAARRREGVVLLSLAILAVALATYPSWSRLVGLR